MMPINEKILTLEEEEGSPKDIREDSWKTKKDSWRWLDWAAHEKTKKKKDNPLINNPFLFFSKTGKEEGK